MSFYRKDGVWSKKDTPDCRAADQKRRKTSGSPLGTRGKLREVQLDLCQHLFVRDRGRTFLPVLRVHPVSNLLDRLGLFIHALGRRDIEVGVNPPRDAGSA